MQFNKSEFENPTSDINTMATIDSTYLSDLRTEATHLQSGTKIITDAPTDNQGKGEAFSPTDLLAEALGSCILTTMAIAGRTHDINIDGAKCEITKVMAADPRRVAEVVVKLKFPQEYDNRQKKILEVAAHGCPVSRSLHPDLKQTIDFGWS